jgi:hypothetical protein
MSPQNKISESDALAEEALGVHSTGYDAFPIVHWSAVEKKLQALPQS